jgi:hypothetical protein
MYNKLVCNTSAFSGTISNVSENADGRIFFSNFKQSDTAT